MNPLFEFWNSLGRRGRVGFAAGLLAIVAIVAILAAWTLREPYGVLFSGLADNDLATMVGELDKMKVPYRVSDDNTQLLVPEAQVRKTRLALMSHELPLHGAVGFELFNNVEFGTSEFVQKINYQRALQGELTRTILAIDEVQTARVHLALPEQGLFRKDTDKAKASVSIATKPGRTLSAPQVQGIQRLVAASVPDVQAQDVTVLDQHGMPLSRLAGDGADTDAASSAQLDLKAGTEKYLAQKATDVLDRSFGKGVAVVSVDAVFVQEQTRVTTEEVLPARSVDPAQVPTGVVVKERQSSHDADGPATQGTPQVSTSETEYQVGHRTEQVTSPAGALKRLDVAVVVRRGLNEVELQRVRDIVSASIGINRDRGDVVAVEAIAPESAAPSGAGASEAVDAALGSTAPKTPSSPRDLGGDTVVALAALLAVALIALLAWTVGRRRPEVPRPLTDEDRARLLRTIQHWLDDGAPSSSR
jgi:flagellar M-ring protein FliF